MFSKANKITYRKKVVKIRTISEVKTTKQSNPFGLFGVNSSRPSNTISSVNCRSIEY